MERRNDGQTHTLCFLDNKPLSFHISIHCCHTREHEQVRRAVYRSDFFLSHATKKFDVLSNFKFFSECLQIFSLCTFSNDGVLNLKIGSLLRSF